MAMNTHHILHHSPMTHGDHRVLWVMLALMALAVIGYALYHGYNHDDATSEYESTTVMGNVSSHDAFRV